ncbi:hypothetical protein BDP27DRAFT_1143789, partial [Rhodocollybia butyracea]
QVLVKFCSPYSSEVHAILAQVNFAPKFLYCTKLTGGVTMIVMGLLTSAEHWENSAAVFLGKLFPKCVVEKVSKALAILHTNNLVFGDMRRPNVMIDEDWEVNLVDFEFSGQQGETRYPALLNTGIEWVEGVQ